MNNCTQDMSVKEGSPTLKIVSISCLRTLPGMS